MQKLLPKLKEEFPWLKTIPSYALQRVCMNLDQALKLSFKSRNKRFGFPKFKNKSNFTDSFYTPNQMILITNNKIKLPKISLMTFRGNLLEGKMLSGTVTQVSGKWYCSIVYEIEELDEIVNPAIENTVGIDLGIKALITTSDGEIIENPKRLRKSEKRLKKLQRQMDKCRKGSSNRKKRQLKLSILHLKVKNQRIDHIHKFTTDLVNNYDVICMEDLNVSGMVKNHKLAKSIQDASFYEIKSQLEYKCEWNNKYFVQIGRFEPSSKTCSSCGNKQDMPLNLRTYNCPSCSLEIDRDLNASINIRNWGYTKLVGQGMTEPFLKRNKACGDASSGISDLSGVSYVSVKQEYQDYQDYDNSNFPSWLINLVSNYQ